MRRRRIPSRPLLAALAGLASLPLLASLAGLALIAGCSFEGGEGDPLGGALDVTGTVVDFRSGEPVTEGVRISTSGLAAATKLVIDGARFTLTGVPKNSAFQLLVTASDHRSTFSVTLVVEEEDLEEVKLPVVSGSFIDDLARAFTTAPNPQRGVLLARVVDASGAPKAGVSAGNFALTAASSGALAPKFLAANLTAAPTAIATTESGWVAFFDVGPGVVSLAQAATATVTLDMAISPINAGAVTLAEIVATDGAPPKLTNISFANQIVPIFTARGCVACHSGGGPGKDLGGLTLTGPASKIYKELLEEDLTRVRAGMPEMSLLLTMPSREAPPDRHPNVTFTSTADLDFQKIYVWIKEGAKEN